MTSNKQSNAGFWKRVAAFAFDYILIALYIALLIAISLLVNRVFSGLSGTLFGNPVSAQLTGFLLLTLPVVLYFSLFEASSRQATWGKQRRGLAVVDAKGERLSNGRAFGRSLLKFLPWELAHTCIWQVRFAGPEASPLITAGFILVWVLVGANFLSLWLSPSNQTLYDKLAGTLVVGRR